MNWKLILLVWLGTNVAFAGPDKKLQKLYNKKNYEKLLTKTSNFENKIDEVTAAKFTVIATLKLNPTLDDSLEIKELNKMAVVIQKSKSKDKIAKTAVTDFRTFLTKATSRFAKDKDTLNLRFVSNLLVATYKDSIGFKRYLAPKIVKPLIASKDKKRSPNRDSIFFYADKFLGIPYKWAGTTPISGFDCSGFTRYVYKQIGIELIHFAKEQAKQGLQVDWQNAKKGDLIFFGKQYENGRLKIEHVGIFHSIKENGMPLIVHCSSQGTVYQELKPNDYWMRKLLFCANVIDNTQSFLTNK